MTRPVGQTRAAILLAAATGCSAAVSASRAGEGTPSAPPDRDGAPDGAGGSASADAAPAANPAECTNAPIGLDEATPFGVSARQVLRSLHAEGQRFVLREDHLGFFDQAGLSASPRPGGDEATYAFTPTGAVATYSAPCSESRALPGGGGLVALVTVPHGPQLSLEGSVTVQLLRGATLTSPVGLIIDVSSPAAPSTTAMGFAEYSGHRVQIAWQLGARSHAILRAGNGDSFWDPAPEPVVDEAARHGPIGDFATAATALSGRRMGCHVYRNPDDPPPSPSGPPDPGPYRGAGPTISVASLGEARIALDFAWSGETNPMRFALPVERAKRTATVQGYRIVGWGSRNAPLPEPLARWSACPDAGRWWVIVEAFPDSQGKLKASFTVNWGAACNRRVACTVR